MKEVSVLSINGEMYTLKDKYARALIESFNDVSVPIIENVGTLPSWNSSVNDETLSFEFSSGTLPNLININLLQKGD